jgi:hypothetical protein
MLPEPTAANEIVTTTEKKTAALQDFKSAYVGSGSESVHTAGLAACPLRAC